MYGQRKGNPSQGPERYRSEKFAQRHKLVCDQEHHQYKVTAVGECCQQHSVYLSVQSCDEWVMMAGNSFL